MENFLTQIKDILLKSIKSKIIIIGKGSSIDHIKHDLIVEYIVIGINDAERIVPCDFTIFHDQRFILPIRENGYLSKLYISPHELSLNRDRWQRVEHITSNQDNIDLVFKRLATDDIQEFVIDDLLFVSALNLAKIISEILNQKTKVYMVGFDFDTNKGYSKSFTDELLGDLYKKSAVRINPQYNYFKHCIYLLKNSNIEIMHVGNYEFSRLSYSEFNEYSHNNNNNNKLPIISNDIIIVAELTTNHFGDRDRLSKMVYLAKVSGANYVKVQKRDVESFYSQKDLDSSYESPFGKTFRDYRTKLELDFEDFVYLDQICKKHEIGWFSSVLDRKSFDFISLFKPNLIKIPSTISEDDDLIQYVFNHYHGDLVISTGMTNKDYLDFILSSRLSNSKLYLMHTNSAYPTTVDEININIVRLYDDLSKANSNIIPAYSSHDEGSLGSIMAVAAGARMIEKHVKFGSNNWAHFDAVALDLESGEFRKYVEEIRKAEIALGSSLKIRNLSENHKYYRVTSHEK
jgi:sialic acid synthase SpsE